MSDEITEAIISNKSYNDIKEIIEQNLKILNDLDNEGHTPLHIAINKDKINIVILLLNQQYININMQNIWGDTPLHIAVHIYQKDIIKLLLNDKDIDVNRQNTFGLTPLYYAIFNKHLDIAKLLIKKGANATNPIDNKSINDCIRKYRYIKALN